MDLKQFKELKINGLQMASLSIGGVVIWSKGVEPEPIQHEYVDLGLPSGLK